MTQQQVESIGDRVVNEWRAERYKYDDYDLAEQTGLEQRLHDLKFDLVSRFCREDDELEDAVYEYIEENYS